MLFSIRTQAFPSSCGENDDRVPRPSEARFQCEIAGPINKKSRALHPVNNRD